MIKAKDMARVAMLNRPENKLLSTFTPVIEKQADNGKRFAQFQVCNDELYFLFDAEKELERAGFVIHRLDDISIGDITVTW